MEYKTIEKYYLEKVNDYNYSIKIISNNNDYKEIINSIFLKIVKGFKYENAVFFTAEKVEHLEYYLNISCAVSIYISFYYKYTNFR